MNKLRYPDKKFQFWAKIIMLCIYLWSCVFWAGVAILHFYINSPDESHIATGFLVGSLLITVSLVLCYFRFYIIQFPFCVAGSAMYLKIAGEMIDVADKTAIVFKPTFTQRYLPEIAIIIICFSLFVIKIAEIAGRKIDERERFNNSPTKSIFDGK